MKREQISKSSSPVLSPPSGSPRQINRSTSVNSGEKTPPSSPSTSNRISPYIGVPPVQFIGGKPIPPVPHSVSKCVDCNIVSYKHENFIIHTKHYCLGCFHGVLQFHRSIKLTAHTTILLEVKLNTNNSWWRLRLFLIRYMYFPNIFLEYFSFF